MIQQWKLFGSDGVFLNWDTILIGHVLRVEESKTKGERQQVIFKLLLKKLHNTNSLQPFCRCKHNVS